MITLSDPTGVRIDPLDSNGSEGRSQSEAGKITITPGYILFKIGRWIGIQTT